MRMRGQEEIKDQLIVGRWFGDQELNDMSSSKVYSYVLDAGCCLTMAVWLDVVVVGWTE
jgi:hypothetical protein